ncbi:5060_t:CDS:2 [Acaulospora morrowiae]|uniref:5060_t:CDS:1 n=1 Tax=Acaulospora morrowiae TaxID=94023 RepID=A0A9N9AJ65_9GLOM|nr:5060_t:CDS:2 [Acaulospora morrowiae]
MNIPTAIVIFLISIISNFTFATEGRNTVQLVPFNVQVPITVVQKNVVSFVIARIVVNRAIFVARLIVVRRVTPVVEAPVDNKVFKYRDIAKTNDDNTPAYDYDFDNKKLIITTLGKLTINGKIESKFDADHVFEAQILPNFLKSLGSYGEKICNFILNSPDFLYKIQEIINHKSNLRFLIDRLNSGKGNIFQGNNYKERQGVKDYLSTDDAYNAYSNTRNKVSAFLKEVVNAMPNVLNKRNIGITPTHTSERDSDFNITMQISKRDLNLNSTSFEDYSRFMYEDLTGRKLPPDGTSSNTPSKSSSTLLFPCFFITSTVIVLNLIF